MIADIIILALVLGYCAFLIYKGYKKRRVGKPVGCAGCSGNCGSCGMGTCGSYKKPADSGMPGMADAPRK